ncbi:Bifunctional hemolysin/adenylate cyclase precursor [Shimia sp. SK013]|uniref:calcium-binding protein n=1 Tax=Shimia sp. SK013 TaxID=1389006 RepID=UPI0006CE17B1|nr:M10 family metallopeptidase C-terminal domain-containing protein [Shimia sp. SK013]KPA23286.1 Bifunctional hemolysin/adenylate cyclase precursor [Shimia sp. SK013]
MPTYFQHEQYGLAHLFSEHFADRWNTAFVTETMNGEVRIGFSPSSPIVYGVMQLNGDDLVVINGELISGTITSIDFYYPGYPSGGSFGVGFLDGQLTGLNWGAQDFQSQLAAFAAGDYSGFNQAILDTVTTVICVDTRPTVHSGDYANANSFVLGNNDGTFSFEHSALGTSVPITINGGHGYDIFSVSWYVPPPTPLSPAPTFTIDLEAGTFTDLYGTTHRILNFEEVIGSSANNHITGYENVSNALTGGVGDDTLLGGNQSDTLVGGSGNDLLVAGDGDDVIMGSDNFSDDDDTINGGDGIDTYRTSYSSDHFVDLTNTYSTPHGNTRTFIDIENVITRSGDDTIIGNGVDNRIESWAGEDLILAGGGNDTVIGGSGNDILVGGTGENELTGGRDEDQFVFVTLNASDTITDFTMSEDTLDFSSLAADSGIFSVTMNGLETIRINCFDDTASGILALSIVQSGDAVEIYVTSGGIAASGSTPLATLLDVNLADLSWDDFIF